MKRECGSHAYHIAFSMVAIPLDLKIHKNGITKTLAKGGTLRIDMFFVFIGKRNIQNPSGNLHSAGVLMIFLKNLCSVFPRKDECHTSQKLSSWQDQPIVPRLLKWLHLC